MEKRLSRFRLGSQAGFAATTSIMGTSDQTLPFFTQLFHFHAEFNDLPTFMYACSSYQQPSEFSR
jgi:hypothetical protein